MYVHYPILDWLCMHMNACVSIRVHMHADVCICMPTEDPLHAFHPSACMSVHVYACACMWMTASIILFAIHRCMGCTWWRFTGYLQRVACLCRCNAVHPSQWFGPLWVMIWSVKKSKWVGIEETVVYRSLSKGSCTPSLFIESKAYRVSSSSVCQHMSFPNGQSSTIHSFGVSQRSAWWLPCFIQ